MDKALGAFVAVATSVVLASVVFQFVKKDSQGPTVAKTLVDGGTTVVKYLYS